MDSEDGPSIGFGGLPEHSRRHGVKRTHTTLERSHRRSHSPLFVQESSTPPSRHASPRRQALRLPPLDPSIRTANNPSRNLHRSSYDYRRPVSTMGTANPSIIDLTEEDDDSNSQSPHSPAFDAAEASSRPQRLPHFEREIIDLSADTSPPSANTHLPTGQGEEAGPRVHQSSRRLPRSHMASDRTPNPRFRREPSSDVVFVAAQPISRPDSPQEHTRSNHHILDLTDDNEDEVVHLRTTDRPGLNNNAPIGRGAVRAHPMSREALQQMFGAVGQIPARLMNRIGYGDEDFELGRVETAGAGRAHSHRPRAFAAPGFMDYVGAGFDLGVIDAPVRAPSPKYVPPPSPMKGFTRNPAPEDVVVCPACGDELATGEDEKGQVWIIKTCGHVYCGHCMLNRKRQPPRWKGGSAKGKARAMDPPTTKPFNTCVVDGCDGKTTSKTSVLQIFL